MPRWLRIALHPRRWNMWNWDVYNPKYLDPEEVFLYYILVTAMIGLVGTVIGIVPMVFLGVPDAFNWMGCLPPMLVHLTAPFWAKRFSYFGNIPDMDSYYHDNVNPLPYARRYWDLPKADKANFPSNILDTLNNPHISDSQKRDIAKEMRSTFNAMAKREEARAALLVRHVNIDHVLEQIQEQRKAIDSDTETYREYA